MNPLTKISEDAGYFLRKLARLPKRFNNAKNARKNWPVQAAVAQKLDGYIADFLNDKIDKFVAVPKKTELVGRKIIWQYWHQGMNENMPPLIKTCLHSVEKYAGEYTIMVLTKDSVNDYIELPEVVWKKFGTGGFVFPKLANLIRLYLLSAYGGVWLDATIYLTAPISPHYLDMDFFALQRSEIPPADVRIFTRFDPIGLSWLPQSYVRMQNSYMIAKPHHPIIDDLLSIHLEYWRNETEIGHYFFFQIMFNRMMRHDRWKNLNCEIVSYADFHRFLIAGFDRFNPAYYNEVKNRWNVHKLSLHWAKKWAKHQIPSGSLAHWIITRNIEKETTHEH